MTVWFLTGSRIAATGALILGATLAASALAENGPPPGTPSPAQLAIDYRQALYTVLGGNFGPIVAVMQGHAEFKPAEMIKHAERLAFLATMIGDAFPDISKTGHTQAKPEIWTHRVDFDKKVAALQTETAALVAELKGDNSNSAAFKKAAAAVGQACKSCHDDFKQKD